MNKRWFNYLILSIFKNNNSIINYLKLNFYFRNLIMGSNKQLDEVIAIKYNQDKWEARYDNLQGRYDKLQDKYYEMEKYFKEQIKSQQDKFDQKDQKYNELFDKYDNLKQQIKQGNFDVSFYNNHIVMSLKVDF